MDCCISLAILKQIGSPISFVYRETLDGEGPDEIMRMQNSGYASF